ncbi:hypothetical protein CDL15_Pgr029171 [Punica granatum]|uniref:Uncharacterized protein n=1 Tax=Punica granatum TaxID=22663 RepID=A0A218XDK2_PUNGR|nr:hypothetical protein CDL15_Pgr029171 [Punica granatum]
MAAAALSSPEPGAGAKGIVEQKQQRRACRLVGRGSRLSHTQASSSAARRRRSSLAGRTTGSHSCDRRRAGTAISSASQRERKKERE